MGDCESQRSWHQFTEETTMHGIRYANTKNISLIRRIIWSSIIIGCLGYFGYATYLFMNGYAQRLVKTTIKVKNASNLTFPTITICNRNYWMKSRAETPGVPAELNKIKEELMRDVFSTRLESPPPLEKYNWDDPQLAFLLRSTGNGTEELMKHLAHGLNETFIVCNIKGSPVNCTEVLKRVKTDAGYCYQFNSDRSFVTNAAGMMSGVQFVMDTLTSEYYVGPFSYAEGFSVAVHDADDVPLVSELSYGISPGTETNIILQRTETIREPPPADNGQSDCFDTTTRKNPLHYFHNYTYAACYQECKVTFTINRCGCRFILQEPLNGTESCNIKEMLYCSNPALKEFYAKPDYLDACACKSVCREVQYRGRLSSYKFPSQRFVEDRQSQGSNYTYDYLVKNVVSVNIFYGQLSYEILEENLAYTPYDLIANLGGTFGVCVGASLLTLVEFVEFGVISLISYVCKRTNNQSRVTAVKAFEHSDIS